MVSFLWLVVALAGSLWAGTSPAAGSAEEILVAAGTERPNIILITSDDQRAADMIAMQRTRQLLGDSGTTFERAYSPFPLCCPSRASMLTGQYAHNHGVLGNGGGPTPVGGVADFDDTSTVATWLSDAGYTTAFVGKYLNQYDEQDPVRVPPGWDDWHAFVSHVNYQYAEIYENGVINEYRGKYVTDLTAQIASDAITAAAAGEAPFFLWTSFNAPHTGGPTEPDDPVGGLNTPAVALRHRDAFAGTPLPKDPSWNEADVSDKPAFIRDQRPISTRTETNLTELYQQRLEALLALDEGVNLMVETLAAAGELDNTLIVFTSDNGYMLGEHRMHAGKTVAYEPSAQVPLIVAGPGFPAGVTRSQPVAVIDLAPTFIEAAGATAGLPIDGVPLQPLASDPTIAVDRTLVVEAGPQEINGPWFYRGIRTRDYLYLEYEATGEVEYYDLIADPFQLVNLAFQPSPVTELQLGHLSNRLGLLDDCSGRGCQR